MRFLFKLIFNLGLTVAPFGIANAKVVAKCVGLMLPDEIKDGEISWQLLEDFALYVEKDASGLSAREGSRDNGTSFSADEVVRTELSKEATQTVLAQIQMFDETTGLPFNVFGIDPGEVTRGILYKVAKRSGAQDGTPMALFVFKDENNKTAGKLIQVGALLGTCQR